MKVAQRACLVLCVFGCMAVASAAQTPVDSTAVGWAESYGSAEGARGAALSECGSRGGSGCMVRFWGCNGPVVKEGLGLDRSARREIQAGLQAQGFDPGGVDGMFGPRTRAAIRSWQSSQGARATGYLRRPGDVFRECDECPEMVVLPGGGLAMGRYEVTVGEYRAFASATGGTGDDQWRDPSRTGFPQTDRHPVAHVSWYDAQAYVSWLSRRTGAAYRLPTETEWERAAAGSQRGCNRTLRIGPPDGTCPVGSYGSNTAGLSDMVGNLWEWTSDCWEGSCDVRVLRGGSWNFGGTFLRPSERILDAAASRDWLQGFRVSRTLD